MGALEFWEHGYINKSKVAERVLKLLGIEAKQPLAKVRQLLAASKSKQRTIEAIDKVRKEFFAETL